MVNENPAQVYLPLEQRERSAQINHDELLPQQVYTHLVQAIEGALERMSSDRTHDFDEQRVHNAVLLDGDRGMGKTTVLVNLPQVLEQRKGEQFKRRVHVLKPVDPTLLEDGDSLFLNMVVAAVLTDTKVAEARQRGEEAAQLLNRSVQRLGEALEGRQTQEREIGIDRLRAFVGSHELARRVHEFFKATLKLLDAQLLVLPIDDVDTSLTRAFENLEVVRRYLATPLVLPVVCGDLNLYSSLLWRESFRRLHPGLQASETEQGIVLHDLEEARAQARNLGQEYLRKVLPAQLRCQMPSMQSYLESPQVVIRGAGPSPQMELSLPLFHAWLRALLLGPVNMIENSGDLPLPLGSVRALVQVLGACKGLVPELHKTLTSHTDVFKVSVVGQQVLRLHRALQMPTLPADFIERFAVAAAKDVRLRSAYPALGNVSSPANAEADPLMARVPAWLGVLRHQWRHERSAGRAVLVLTAWEHWNASLNRGDKVLRVLETPLFRPSLQQRAEFNQFDFNVELNWQERLRNYYPERALSKLVSRAILPMAVPELGHPLARSRDYVLAPDCFSGDANRNAADANLLTRLLIDDDFYSTSQRSTLCQIGRLLELLVMSMVADVTILDVYELMARPPFHSVTDMVPTKTLDDGDDEPQKDSEGKTQLAEIDDDGAEAGAVERLVLALNDWRSQWQLSLECALPGASTAEAARVCRISPWLLYCVLNKVLNQAEYFNPGVRRIKGTSEMQRLTPQKAWHPSDTWAVGQRAFNAFWAALGSFEKGPVFGLPSIVATINLGVEDIDFKQHPLYRQNVAPFVSEQADQFGRATRSLTAALKNHPLKLMLERVTEESILRASVGVNEQGNDKASAFMAVGAPISPSQWLLQELGYPSGKQANITRIATQLAEPGWDREKALRLLDSLRTRFPVARDTASRLEKAIQAVFRDKP